jgi:phage gp29-like protein
VSKSFGRISVAVDEGLERLGQIPREIKPSELATIKVQAETQGAIGKLYELYDKMAETDSRVSGLVRQLTSELLSLSLKIEPALGHTAAEIALAQDYARVAEDALREFDTKTFGKEVVDGYLSGLQMFDLVWGFQDVHGGKQIAVPVRAKRVSPAKFKMEARTDNKRYGKLSILTDEHRQYGRPVEDYDPRKLLVVHDTNMEGRWDVAGVHRTIIGWWLVKTYAQYWWAEYTENYGKPLRIARHPENANEDTLKKVEKFLRILGQHAYALIPDGIDLQLLEANIGANNAHESLIRMCNDEIALAIVGQVETQGDRRYGSQAKARELGNIRYENMKYTCGTVGAAYTDLVDIILWVNYGTSYVPHLRPNVAPLLINPRETPTKIQNFVSLQEAGLPVSTQEIYEQTGIAMPKEGDPVLINGQIQEYIDGETGFHNDPAKQSGPDNQTGSEEETGEGDSGANGGDDQA